MILNQTELEQLVHRIKTKLKAEIESDDTEVAHANADDALCEFISKLGFCEITELYYKVPKWYA